MVYCSFRNAYLLLSTNRVRTSTVYLLSEGATSVLVPISFLLKGSDKIVSYCPLVPQYEVKTSSVSLLHWILCSHYLMAWDLPYYLHTEYQLNVSAYFRDTLRWQTTRFTSLCHPTLHLTVKTESHGVGFTSVVSSLWG